MTEILKQSNIDLDSEAIWHGGQSLEQRLGAVNWDFPERISHSDIEGIHPYPAKFIAEIPRTLLSRISVKPDTAVLDPFCGSGTTEPPREFRRPVSLSHAALHDRLDPS